MLLLVLSAFTAGSAAHAQWKQLHTFGGVVSAVKFLGDVGLPNVGFVGSGSFVYRTADGGTTWTIALRVTGASASSLSFKDGQTGWCTMYGLTTGYACYKTTNGGTSWFALAPVGEGCDVLYNRTTDILLVSLRAGQVLASIDGGNSFVVYQAGMNGFAFATGSNGICTSINNGVKAFAATTDGGQSWSNVLEGQHCWSPCAVPATSSYVAPRDLTQEVFTSSDLGQSWQATGRVNGALTGCAQATDCAVYVQSSIGMFVSTSGSAWTYLIGSPGNDYDTRFCISGGDIFAGDAAGQVFRASASVTAWPTVHFDQVPSTVTIAPGCTPELVPASFRNLTCSDITVVSITISDSSAWRLLKLTGTPPPTLPAIIHPGDTLGMLLSAGSKESRVFKTRLVIRLKNGVGVSDTTITLTLDASHIISPTVGPLVMSGVQCEPRDTVIRIHNPHCDTIRLTELYLDLPTEFVMPPIALPIYLPADSDLFVPLTFVGTKSGDSRDALHATFTYGSMVIDTIVYVDAHVKVSSPSARLSNARVEFDPITTCEETERALTVTNTSCDAVFLTELTLNADPAITLAPVTLPVLIPSGDSTVVRLHLKPVAAGAASGHLDIMLSHEGVEKLYGVDVAGTAVEAPHGLSLAPISIVSDSLSPCVPFDTTVALWITGPCDSLILNSILADDSLYSSKSDRSLPTVLHAGDTLRIAVHVDPGVSASTARLRLLGPAFDSSVSVRCSFRVVAAPDLQLAVSQSSFTLHQCDLDSGTFTLSALGCSAIDVDSLTISGADNLRLSDAARDTTLACSVTPGNDTAIRFYVSGDAVPGSYFALLTVISKQGFRRTVPLFVTVLPQDKTALALRPAAAGGRVNAGSTLTSELYFSRGVTEASVLTRIDCSIAFDRDILGEVSITPMNGWSVVVAGSSRSGLDLQCSRSSTSAIADGDLLLTIQHRATVSRSLSTRLQLAKVTLMPDVPRYTECVLSASFDSSGFAEEIAYTCPDSTLARFMRGELLISNLRISPQPSAGLATLSLRAARSGPLDIAIVDLTGREVGRMEEWVQTGPNTFDLDLHSLPSGNYWLTAVVRANDPSPDGPGWPAVTGVPLTLTR